MKNPHPKFKTFADFSPSPQQPQYSPSPEHNQVSTFPNEHIDELKKQIEEALNRTESRMNENRYETQISLMRSDVSLENIMLHDDLPSNLTSLEMNIAENILGLREEKITLMQEYNKILGEKYEIEREKIRLKNQLEKSEDSNFLDKTDPVILRNIELHKEYESLIKYEEMLKYLSSQCDSIEEEIQSLAKEKIDNSLVDELRTTRYHLLSKLAGALPYSTKTTLIQLIKEQKLLQAKCSELLLLSKFTNVELKQRVEKENRQKQVFLEDLKTFKGQIKRLRKQNHLLSM